MATKAEKQAAKEEKRAEKAEIAQVKAAQKAETTLLKKEGVPKSVIKAETKSNKTELEQAKALLAAQGKQTLLTQGQPTYLSAASNYSGQTATNVQQALNNAAAKYGSLGITNVSKSGNTTIGLGIDKIVKYDLGEAGNQVTKTIDRAQQFVGKSFTPDELTAQGVKIKPVKGADGLFQYKTGSAGNNVYTFFRQDANGNLVGTGVNRTSTPQADGGFFSSPLGQALMIGGSIALALTPGGQAFAAQIGSTLSGGALAANSLAAQALGQAVIRGVSTGVITGDVEKGLIAGAISGAGSALNLSGELGNIFDATGLGDYKDAFGVIGGNVSEASFAAADAAQLAAQGLGSSAIQQNLIMAGLDPVLAASAADLAASGLSASQIASDLSRAAGGQSLFGDVVTGDMTGITSEAGVADGLPITEGAAQVTDIAGNAVTPSTLPSLGEGAFDMGGAAGTGLLDATTAAGVLGTGLTAKELISGANTARQVAGLLGLGGGAGGAAGGAGAGAGGAFGGLFGGTNLGQLAAPFIDYAELNKIAGETQQLGSQLAREAAQIGVQNQTPFTPYTLTTGAGTATIGPGSATATAAAPYEALRQQALTQAQQTLGAINPAQATQQFYQNLEALAGPTRQREQEALLSGLGARGLLGIGRNLPTAGGAVRGVNPFQESLLAAQEQGRITQALTAQQYGTSEAARQQALAQNLQAQAMGVDEQTMRQLAQARTLGLDERSLAQQNAALRAKTALAGLELRQPYDLFGLEAMRANVGAVADIGRGMFGLPTQAGNRPSSGINFGGALNTIFSNLLNQGMTAEQAADYVNSISSGLDISGESAGTQSLIEQMQEYGIF